VEPSPVHRWGGHWTGVRTHTPIKLSKAASAFASHPLGWPQVSRERVAALPEPCLHVSAHTALHPWRCPRGCTFQADSIRMSYFSSVGLKDCLPSPQRLAFDSVTTTYTLADPDNSGC